MTTLETMTVGVLCIQSAYHVARLYIEWRKMKALENH